jgi:hypothetical protein
VAFGIISKIGENFHKDRRDQWQDHRQKSSFSFNSVPSTIAGNHKRLPIGTVRLKLLSHRPVPGTWAPTAIRALALGARFHYRQTSSLRKQTFGAQRGFS